jgi:hypothetical protein
MQRYTVLRLRSDGDYDHVEVVETTNDAGEQSITESVFAIVPAADRDYPFGRDSDDDAANMNRAMRGSLLEETDWTQLADVSSSVKSQYASYRQALRDLPTHANWPHLTTEDWPVKPE